MKAVGDLGAVLRWVGLLPGPAPELRSIVSADALLGELLEYVRARFDGRPGLMNSSMAEIQFAVDEWYPTWPVLGRLTSISTTISGLDVTLLTPIAISAELDLPLATTSAEIATIARPFVPSVVLL